METTKLITTPFVLADEEVGRQEADALLVGAVVAEADVAVVGVTGPGVIPCLQGILTADIEGLGDGGFGYGAMLTNKGMIVCDMWAARHGNYVWLTIPAQGTEPLFEAFGRFLPPRLARAEELSETTAVLRIAGPDALNVAAGAGIGVPEPGGSSNTVVGKVACIVSRPSQQAPFTMQIQLDRGALATVRDALANAGALTTGPPILELARILAGWPRLGSEIDEKTLPHEVRFDEHNGVSYTKGCYTGQETVARVHFRGHVNKQLIGLLWDGTPDPVNAAVLQGSKPVGRVTSIAWLPHFEQHIGLGIVRHKVDTERIFTAAGAPAVAARLPFELVP
jgi:folate-binding protein YgfZ